MLRSLYSELLERHGRQGWWPIYDPEEGELRYRPGDYSLPTRRNRVQVIAGAVLAQNTSWTGAARAVANLVEAGLDRWEALAEVSHSELERRIRPSRFYRQKARRLKVMADFFGDAAEPDRDQLLGLWGVGPETADSILLYAFGVPVMVVDAYLRRVLRDRGRPEVADRDYEQIRSWAESRLPARPDVLNEMHALVVAEGKRISGEGGE